MRKCVYCRQVVKLANIRASSRSDAGVQNDWVHEGPGAWLRCPGPRARPERDPEDRRIGLAKARSDQGAA